MGILPMKSTAAHPCYLFLLDTENDTADNNGGILYDLAECCQIPVWGDTVSIGAQDVGYTLI